MPTRLFLGLLLLGCALACGGGGGSSSSAPTGQLTLRLGSDSFPGYDQAVVSVEKVDASPDGSTWVSLGSVQNSYDLMKLQGGHSVALFQNPVTVPATTYTQFRITWATQNYADPTRQPAYVYPTGAGTGQPMSMPTTTLLPGSVTVASGGSVTVQLMLSGQQAVQQRAGVSPPYTFQATGQAYDLSQAATISGTLADGSTPLAGVEVYAETVDGLGTATIQRRAFTDATGKYQLECLPASGSPAYFVVAQPGSGTSAYQAQVSAPVNVTASPASPVNLAFSGAAQPGSLTLTLTPPSTLSQGTWGELRQGLSPAPGLSYQFIVRSQGAVTGATQDQVYFTGLAPSYYGVTSERSTAGATPAMLVYNGQLAVASGAIAQASLAY